MTGYLTVSERPSGGKYALRIPNREVRQIYTQQVLSWFRESVRKDTDKLTALYTAFEAGDTETIANYLNRQLITTVSFHDARESFYHGFLLALLSTCATWEVSSNAETGIGRADIIVEREDGQLVDFDQAMKRQQQYRTEEGRAKLAYEEGDTHHGGCGHCGGDK